MIEREPVVIPAGSATRVVCVGIGAMIALVGVFAAFIAPAVRPPTAETLDPVGGWVILGIGAAITLAGLFLRPRLTLDAEGVRWHGIRRWSIWWEDLSRAEITWVEDGEGHTHSHLVLHSRRGPPRRIGVDDLPDPHAALRLVRDWHRQFTDPGAPPLAEPEGTPSAELASGDRREETFPGEPVENVHSVGRVVFLLVVMLLALGGLLVLIVLTRLPEWLYAPLIMATILLPLGSASGWRPRKPGPPPEP